MRVALAGALFIEPDLLMLDEVRGCVCACVCVCVCVCMCLCVLCVCVLSLHFICFISAIIYEFLRIWSLKYYRNFIFNLEFL